MRVRITSRVMRRAEDIQNPPEGDLEDLVQSWIRSLRAGNLSRKTIITYTETATQLLAHGRACAGLVDAAELRRAHVEDFLADLAATRSPATVSDSPG